MNYEDILVEKKVKHWIFGEGTIKACNLPHVTMYFPKYGKTISMKYPDAFKKDVSVNDAALNDIIQRDIEAGDFEKKLKEEAAKKKKAAEAGEKRWKELNSKIKESNDKFRKFRPFNDLDSFFSHYERELTAEIQYLKLNGGKHYRVFDGILIEQKNGKVIYSFDTDTEYSFPDGTQIHIWVTATDNIGGKILCCADHSILLEADGDLGKKVDILEFSADLWRLLNFLIKRLETLQSARTSSIVRELVCEGRKKVQYGIPLASGQDNASKMAMSQPITFIWGPPGTGKTETLAKIAIEHMNAGNRILMVSHSNVSVDGALLRVHRKIEEEIPGHLIRYGYPKDAELLQHDYLTSHNYVLQKHPDLLAEQRKLYGESKQKDLKNVNPERFWQIQQRLNIIQNILADEEKQVVRNARFIATTVSKAVVDKTIYEAEFDVVIFDEASMAYLPQIAFVAGLAKKHFICMGDFSQLPPIVQNGRDSTLNVDIFQYCGIQDAVESGNGHEWLCILDIQYRMHPDIASFASKEMYHNLLKSADGMREKRENLVYLSPLAGIPIGIADLSGMMSTCIQTADSSRVNPLSALISVGLAIDSATTSTVGVIVPYQAQARLINAMARDLALRNRDLKKIVSATVHQFQGSEQDVIIYDTVDCYRQRFPGTLLTLITNNYANRLFNVALTRAKGKFISVVNIDYMQRKKLSKKLMFTKLLVQKSGNAGKIFGQSLIESIRTLTENIEGFDCIDESVAAGVFLENIESAKKEIRIDIVGGITLSEVDIERLAQLLHSAKEKDINVIVRTERKELLPRVLKPFAVENHYIANTVTVLDRRIVWFGAPASDAHFVSEEETIETKYHPIIRFEGAYTANALYGFLEMSKTFDQSIVYVDDEGNTMFAQHVRENVTCGICGQPMMLRKGKSGSKSLFMGCSEYPNCTYTAEPDLALVSQYLNIRREQGMRCKYCGSQLYAKAGKSVYVQCTGNDRHNFSLDEI